MNLQKIFLAFSLLSITILSACKKNDNQPDQSAVKGTITAKINGVATNFQGAALKASDNEGTLIFSTGVSNNQVIAFGIFAPTITAGKTYNAAIADDAPGSFIGYFTKEQVEADDESGYVSTYDGSNGSVTITSISNDAIQGTFTGTLRFQNKGIMTNQTLAVTEGKFNLTITTVNNIPGNNGITFSPFNNTLK